MATRTWFVGFISFAALLPGFVSAATINISIIDNQFTVPNATINVGDTVVWTNNGSVNHNVLADDATFGSGTLAPGASYSRTFTSAGAFRYYCSFHGAAGGIGQSAIVSVAAPAVQIVQTPPVTAPSGGSAADLRAQVQTLLARVMQLQQQLGGSVVTSTAGPVINPRTGTSIPVAEGVNVNSSSCPNIGRVLKKGASGDDVRRLQEFLAQDPSVYADGTVSGYFGTLTENAVKKWQVKYNIVSSGTPDTTGWGVVGPRTAAAIALLCSQGGGGAAAMSPVGGFIQVSPIGGNAPLTVNVQATVNTTNSCAGAIYSLDWGDGSNPVQIPVSANNCNQVSQPYTHVYQYGGNYLITLSAGSHRTTASVAVYGATQPTQPTQPPPTQPTNPPPAQPVSYGPLGLTPGVDNNPLRVSASFQIPSSCTGYELSWGDGSGNEVQADGGSSCSQTTTSKQFAHTYTTSGAYTITLKRGPTLGTVDSASITVSSSN